MKRTIIGDHGNGHGPIVWRPSPELVAESRLTAFMARHDLRSLDELQRRSVTDIDWFWNAVLEDLGGAR